MEYKKQFTSNVKVDFSAIRFYEIPFAFFAQWLHLTLEIAKIIQPDFHVDIPKKALDWYQFPDREVYDTEFGSAYTLRTASVLLKNGDYTIHMLAQYGYEPIPGQHIIVKTNGTNGGIFSRNMLRNGTIDFQMQVEEAQLAAVEEVFFVFQ